MAAIRTLLLLRLRLILRRGTAARRRRSVFILLQLLIGLAVAVLAALSLAAVLGSVLTGPMGHALLLPLLTWASSWSTLLLFLFAVPAVLGAFTYNSDLGLLLLTPVSPRLLVAEKLVSIAGWFVLLLLVGGLTVLLAIGQTLGLGVGFDVAAAVALLLLPLAPLSVALLLTVSVLRWAPPARARGITSVLGALIAIGAYLVSRSLGTSGGATRSADLRDLVAATSHAWWSTLPSTWPGRALAAAGLGDAASAWGYLAATAVLALALAVLAVMLAAHLFATGWATYHEVGRRRPRTTGRATSAATTARSLPALGSLDRREIALGYVRGGARPTTPPVTVGLSTSTAMIETGVRAWWPLIGKEWRSLRRDTQVWARLLYPLFVVGFGFYNAVGQSSAGGGTFANASASDVLQLGWFYGTLAMLAYLLLTALALPLINREGRSLYLLALAPLSARDILLAKWSFCALPAGGLVEALLIASGVVMHITAGIVLLSMLAYAGLVVALSGAQLTVSLIWPRLDWDNPRRQVSGPASLVGSFGGLLLAAVVCGLLIATVALWPRQPNLALVTGIVLFALCGFIALAVFLIAPRRLERLLMR